MLNWFKNMDDVTPLEPPLNLCKWGVLSVLFVNRLVRCAVGVICIWLYGAMQTTLQACMLHWFKSMDDVTRLEPPLNLCR
jgi:hypothetical protein